jgi:possible glycerophosphoryl diester phosphodiesterase
VVKGKYFYFVINGQYSAQIHDSAYRGPYVHFGRYHGNATGGPLVLTRALARESWA